MLSIVYLSIGRCPTLPALGPSASEATSMGFPELKNRLVLPTIGSRPEQKSRLGYLALPVRHLWVQGLEGQADSAQI